MRRTIVDDLVPIGEDIAIAIYAWLLTIGFDLAGVPGVGRWFQILRSDF